MKKHQVLKKIYGYDKFREGQEELIDSALAMRDTLGIMPTGAGKSICFQIPALLFNGISIIISPLISLMKDQVAALNEVGVHAAYINSSLTEGQIKKAMQNACNGNYKIIYVAPERLMTDLFLELVDSVEISMIAIDEAHCLSQWGQDFRPSYLKIVDFIKILPVRPVITAYTATATKTVKEDIICILNLHNPTVVVTGYDRKNLYFAVRKRSDKEKEKGLIQYLEKKTNESGIIYCNTRKNVDEVYERLREKGYLVSKYHAGMSDYDRKESQENFVYDRTGIMVATNAFGMGIDKSNVRFVIHYNMPKDMESYYQEAGRAGRDGEPAECVLLYSGQDVMVNEFLIDKQAENVEFDYETRMAIRERNRERLKKMTFYCYTNECLREYILRYFEEYGTSYCGNCENCLTEFEKTDITFETEAFLKLVKTSGERYGINAILDALHGSETVKVRQYRLNQNPFYASLKDRTVVKLRRIVNELMLLDYLVLTTDEYPVVKIGQKGKIFLETKTPVSIILKLPKDAEKSTVRKKSTRAEVSTAKYPELFERLRKKRLEIAKEEHMPPYIIFSDKTLKEMSTYLPDTDKKMLEINGVGDNKLQKYGRIFIDIIYQYKDEKNL